MTRTYAREQSLPEEEVLTLQSLRGPSQGVRIYALYEAGWTLRSIGEAINKSRASIHYIISKMPKPNETPKVPKPEPQYKYVPKRKVPRPIPTDDEAEIRCLAPIARRYRAVMASNHPAAIATRDLNALYKKLYDSGCSIAELAKVGGVSERALRKRLASE